MSLQTREFVSVAWKKVRSRCNVVERTIKLDFKLDGGKIITLLSSTEETIIRKRETSQFFLEILKLSRKRVFRIGKFHIEFLSIF